MTLSEELSWRGFVNQTTYPDIKAIDGQPISFYLGVDPSADSMTVGNLAVVMMVRHFVEHGHKAYLLVGGATGLIGDPDGKSDERELKSLDEIANNKSKIADQYRLILSDQPFEMVDNYDWFKDFGYLEFLRDIGKNVPLSQMLGRDFVQKRLGEQGSGISYAEFSYALIQAYDFLHLHRDKGVNLQVCGADQWGNSIAGVDLTRRINGDSVDVWSAPLVINKTTGIKFGKSEGGAVWLSADKTSPYAFYQFWLNVEDDNVEDYLKIYTLLSKDDIDNVLKDFSNNRSGRVAQKTLAYEVTKLIHGQDQAETQANIAKTIRGEAPIADLDSSALDTLRHEIPNAKVNLSDSVTATLHSCGLASSLTEARRLLAGNAVTLNGQKIDRDNFETSDFQNGVALIRRGKAYKDSALIEL